MMMSTTTVQKLKGWISGLLVAVLLSCSFTCIFSACFTSDTRHCSAHSATTHDSTQTRGCSSGCSMSQPGYTTEAPTQIDLAHPTISNEIVTVTLPHRQYDRPVTKRNFSSPKTLVFKPPHEDAYQNHAPPTIA